MTRARLLILSFSNISADARVLKQVKYFAGRYDVTTYGYGPAPDPRVHHIQLDDAGGIRRWRRQDLILRRFDHVYWNQPAIVRARADLDALARFDVILADDHRHRRRRARRCDPVRRRARRPPRVCAAAEGGAADLARFRRTFLCAGCAGRFLQPRVAVDHHRRAVGSPANTCRRLGITRGGRHQLSALARPRAHGPVASPSDSCTAARACPTAGMELIIDAALAATTEVTLDLYLMLQRPRVRSSELR